jgi:threonine dehydratase
MPQVYATNLQSIKQAAQKLEGRIHRTPVLSSHLINEIAGASLYFKCEQFQKIGAFKIRGATYAIDCLDPMKRANGIVTHSSGNHAQAIALAARTAGIKAHVVMPTNSPTVKKNAVIGYGATVYDCEPTLAARERAANALVNALDATLIPPYNHKHVITGQGTVGLELFEQVEGLDAVLVPIGGGGLCAGTAIALRSLSPSIRIYGVEPIGADDALRSWERGQFVPQDAPNTIADGLRTSMGTMTWPAIRDHIDGVLTVTEKGIINAMKLIWSRMKTVVEPSGAVPLAAVLEHPSHFEKHQKVGLVVTGGNVDLDQLPWLSGR